MCYPIIRVATRWQQNQWARPYYLNINHPMTVRSCYPPGELLWLTILATLHIGVSVWRAGVCANGVR